MNCPSRTDEPAEHEGWNQSPRALSPALTTRQDLNGMANERLQREQGVQEDAGVQETPRIQGEKVEARRVDACVRMASPLPTEKKDYQAPLSSVSMNTSRGSGTGKRLQRAGQAVAKFGKFVGPGFIIAVAYIDPGNYSTDVSAGAATKYNLLFIVLLSNLFAVVLQSLAIRLGTVTGMNLAEHCRAHLPRWMNFILYILAEAAIIATDIAEVIGSAIALNLLFKIPVVGGCALTLLDTLLILLFYDPNGSIRRLRYFEYFIVLLVLAVVICFCIQLSLISGTSLGEVFRGYLPSSTVVKGQGIYLSCGILGATVMPHSLYLGSGLVQARLMEFDGENGRVIRSTSTSTLNSTTDLAHNNTSTSSLGLDSKEYYHPSLKAIKHCLTYSTLELVISLTIFALFVNSAILIVAGASLSNTPDAASADLFSIHALLVSNIAPAAGAIFALALLLSGTSAGIVCTIAGQMVSEGALNWTCKPWIRRLLTRSISILPSIVIAGAVGREGLSAALNASQVVLSVILPFVSAPLVYFTARNRYMTVGGSSAEDVEGDASSTGVGMRNHWAVSVLAVLIWLVLTVMNVALLVTLGLGQS